MSRCLSTSPGPFDIAWMMDVAATLRGGAAPCKRGSQSHKVTKSQSRKVAKPEGDVIFPECIHVTGRLLRLVRVATGRRDSEMLAEHNPGDSAREGKQIRTQFGSVLSPSRDGADFRILPAPV